MRRTRSAFVVLSTLAACAKSPAPAPSASVSAHAVSAVAPTASPTTSAPTTSAPATSAPASSAPASSAPMSSAPTTSASAATSASPARIELQPLTISFRGKLISRLFADGRTEAVGSRAPGEPMTPGPTLHADGTIEMTRGGVTARLDDDGQIWITQPGAGGEVRFGRIVGDELRVGAASGWTVRVHDDMIEFSKTDSSQIDGDVTPGMRRAALVMAAAFYIEGAITSR